MTITETAVALRQRAEDRRVANQWRKDAKAMWRPVREALLKANGNQEVTFTRDEYEENKLPGWPSLDDDLVYCAWDELQDIGFGRWRIYPFDILEEIELVPDLPDYGDLPRESLRPIHERIRNKEKAFRELYPEARMLGGKMAIGNVQGDKGQSARIYLDSGRLYDFATKESHDLVDCIRVVEDTDVKGAIAWLEEKGCM